jgi:hypothetical protein
LEKKEEKKSADEVDLPEYAFAVRLCMKIGGMI